MRANRKKSEIYGLGALNWKSWFELYSFYDKRFATICSLVLL